MMSMVTASAESIVIISFLVYFMTSSGKVLLASDCKNIIGTKI